MAQERCTFIKPDGNRCGAWPPRGEDLCMAHGRADELAMAREDARLRKLGEHEMRKPSARFFEDGWDSRPFRPIAECASAFNVDRSTVSRWYAWVRSRDAQAEVVRDTPRPDGLPVSHFDWTQDHIPGLIDWFIDFRAEYFTTERGKPFVTPAFQQEWAKGIVTAKITGGDVMILAPLRHGKSKLLTHFCVCLFCLDPNLRVLWLGVTQGLAEGPVKQMRGVFESNKGLIADFAGPAGSFVPPVRSLHKWTEREFTLLTRTNLEIPGPNIQALGRGGTIVGKDVDLMVFDDVEDQGAIAQKSMRDSTKQWWNSDAGGRVEEHTGRFVIGSRQDADDIYSLILRTPGWDITVERAHDPACGLPEHDDEAHQDCMLFPEIRSHKWLMIQKRKMSVDAKGAALWEQIYQNVPRVEGLVAFNEEDVKACRNARYWAQTMPGKEQGAGSYRLVAGLDPAITGFQATVLLAYQTEPDLKIWLVDLDNTEGGGHGAVGRIIRKWFEKYGVSHWVVEENTFGQMSYDRDIQQYASAHGIRVQDWRTHLQKTNQFFGVTALAPLFTNGNFVLPYPHGDMPADIYSRQITDTLIGQLLVWDEGNSRNKNRTGDKDDLVMSLWFAWDPIRRARQEWNAEMGVDYDGGYRFSDWDTAPWGDLDQAPWARTG